MCCRQSSKKVNVIQCHTCEAHGQSLIQSDTAYTTEYCLTAKKRMDTAAKPLDRQNVGGPNRLCSSLQRAHVELWTSTHLPYVRYDVMNKRRASSELWDKRQPGFRSVSDEASPVLPALSVGGTPAQCSRRPCGVENQWGPHRVL